MSIMERKSFRVQCDDPRHNGLGKYAMVSDSLTLFRMYLVGLGCLIIPADDDNLERTICPDCVAKGP